MKLISMFSGAGGFDLGMIFAGHQIVWSNDFDKDAVKTYQANIASFHPHTTTSGDIWDAMKDLPAADCIIGGPPCQAYSVSNLDRGMHDPRAQLYKAVIAAVTQTDVPFFLLENVKGLENLEEGEPFEQICQEFEQSGQGYEVSYALLNAKNFGISQNRERLFILGVRKDLTLPIPKIEASPQHPRRTLNIPPTHSDKAQLPIREKPHDETNRYFEQFRANEKIEPFRETLQRKIPTLRDAIGDLPHDFQPNFKQHDGSKCEVKLSKRQGNRATSWDKIAPTVTGRGNGKGGPLIPPHPDAHRRFSVRECARIQSFPDNFNFEGSNSSKYRQIGNAVPIILAMKVGLWLKQIEQDYIGGTKHEETIDGTC